MRRLLRAAAAAAVVMVVCTQAPAQDYPTRSITLIVPYPPGGGVDAMARVVAAKLSAAVGQQVVVDNRAGGSGLVGARALVKSPPDGSTLFLGHTGSIAINPNLYTNAGFDPRKDFAPIGLIASMPVVLLAHPSFPAKTIGEVVAIAKQAGAKLNIGTPPAGTGAYLTAELFRSVTGIDAAIIPFKGTAQLTNDLLGNQVPIAFGVLPPALGNLQAGTLRAIAVFGPARFSLLPDVPTANESGLPGFESVLHYGLLAPAGTPRPIVERLNGALRALVGSEEVKQRILAEGGDPLTSTPEGYAKDIDSEETKWGTLVRKLNLKME